MAHGTPDYGVTAGSLTRHQLDDVGELAARLGSPVTHDRRGDVIWWDDAECGPNHWNFATNGVGSVAGVSTARARNGRTSYNLRTGNVIGNFAYMEHLHASAHPSRIGLELSFNRGNVNGQLDILLLSRNGTRLVQYLIRYDATAQTLQYTDSAGNLQTFATSVNPINDPTLFHTVKLVVDPASERYVRFIFNNVTYDLSLFAGLGSASVLAAHRVVRVTFTTAAAANADTYIDDIILTENEPANP